MGGMQTLRALVIMALAPLVAGFGAFSEDAMFKAQHTLVCSNTVPPLPLDDKVAAVLSGSVDDKVNCLKDAYAQPGLCDLTKQMTNLFQTPADSAEPNCGAAGADFTLQFTALLSASFGIEGTMYVLCKAGAPCAATDC